ncbi:hypothetical protein D5125_12910 [Magnetovirga frankeli]|uniref:hypothetical protein n=1 Tax=Magnetovirga frankeli TaxID=947516 RepID=UPI00129327E8|nr:hypothetical protein D5125_12910 [gamma proteobacterium SS-5]
MSTASLRNRLDRIRQTRKGRKVLTCYNASDPAPLVAFRAEQAALEAQGYDVVAILVEHVQETLT